MDLLNQIIIIIAVSFSLSAFIVSVIKKRKETKKDLFKRLEELRGKYNHYEKEFRELKKFLANAEQVYEKGFINELRSLLDSIHFDDFEYRLRDMDLILMDKSLKNIGTEIKYLEDRIKAIENTILSINNRLSSQEQWEEDCSNEIYTAKKWLKKINGWEENADYNLAPNQLLVINKMQDLIKVYEIETSCLTKKPDWFRKLNLLQSYNSEIYSLYEALEAKAQTISDLRLGDAKAIIENLLNSCKSKYKGNIVLWDKANALYKAIGLDQKEVTDWEKAYAYYLEIQKICNSPEDKPNKMLPRAFAETLGDLEKLRLKKQQ